MSADRAVVPVPLQGRGTGFRSTPGAGELKIDSGVQLSLMVGGDRGDGSIGIAIGDRALVLGVLYDLDVAEGFAERLFDLVQQLRAKRPGGAA